MIDKILEIVRTELPSATIDTRITHVGSLATIGVIMEIEEEFDIEIPDEAIDQVQTVGDIAVLVADRV